MGFDYFFKLSFILLGTPQMSARPPSDTLRTRCGKFVSLGSFEPKNVPSPVAVLGQSEGGGEASIRPALFARPPSLSRRESERETWTMLHIKLHPPWELLSYTTPTASHRPPPSPGREERRPRGRGRKNGCRPPPSAKSPLVLRCPDDRLRRSGTADLSQQYGANPTRSPGPLWGFPAACMWGPSSPSQPKDPSDEFCLGRKFPVITFITSWGSEGQTGVTRLIVWLLRFLWRRHKLTGLTGLTARC